MEKGRGGTGRRAKFTGPALYMHREVERRDPPPPPWVVSPIWPEGGMTFVVAVMTGLSVSTKYSKDIYSRRLLR